MFVIPSEYLESLNIRSQPAQMPERIKDAMQELSAGGSFGYADIAKKTFLEESTLKKDPSFSQGSVDVSDEEQEQGGPIPLGCAAWVVAWFALAFGFAAFGFRNGVPYLIGIPIALLVLPVLIVGIKTARVHHWPHEWGRFVLIAAGLSWIWYIPLTFLAICIPPKAEADGTELSVTECLLTAAEQSFLYHALPMLPLAFLALVTLQKFYQPDYRYTERNDSLVYSGFLSLFVWPNPFVYSHYNVLKTLTSYPKVWLVAIQLLLAFACGFSIGYLPVCQRYYKRGGR